MASLSYRLSNYLCLAVNKHPARKRLLLPLALLALASLTACKKAPTEPPRPTVEVTVVTVRQQ
ncbi:hypothetical protein SB861_46985, partial [Paraburkholderia sp. SIMBA_049]